MKQTDEQQQVEMLSDEDSVVEYLQQHPQFFVEHEKLLATIEIPSSNDENNQKISLLEQKISTLREENKQLQQQLKDLITVAQENDQLNQRIKRLVAALTNVTGMDEFFHTLYSTLCNEFNTDTVVVRCFQPQVLTVTRQEFVEYDAQIFTLFDSMLKSDQPICGQISAEQIEYLFPSSKIASAALIPLGSPEPQGLLAMGSHDSSRFHADMSTDFIRYLGELVSNLLNIWLNR
ncbi:MAG: hypothetical protein DRQ49_03710 [Gammaproteobacteria bacterium]|nr:MAG: hypothetical protein DRQ49_03710 [Gammaproteobacteria bacterium]RKZ71832.1 MAG: hypothetical protein DRQ57_18165 [Gammaproteobacteria bacterium]